ncbi:MAG: DivIVA domain-containing protein [Acidobacteriota bacterium]
MRITPLDIEAHSFAVRIRGYDRDEVKSFLTLISEEYEKLIVENSYLKEEMARLNHQLADHLDRERILKDTLLSVQKLANDMRQEAHREKDIIIKEAELKAEQILEQARRRIAGLEQQIADLKMRRDSFETTVLALIDQHRRVIEMQREQGEIADRVRFMHRRESGNLKEGSRS